MDKTEQSKFLTEKEKIAQAERIKGLMNGVTFRKHVDGEGFEAPHSLIAEFPKNALSEEELQELCELLTSATMNSLHPFTTRTRSNDNIVISSPVTGVNNFRIREFNLTRTELRSIGIFSEEPYINADTSEQSAAHKEPLFYIGKGSKNTYLVRMDLKHIKSTESKEFKEEWQRVTKALETESIQPFPRQSDNGYTAIQIGVTSEPIAKRIL